jgi:hypothetical protein
MEKHQWPQICRSTNKTEVNLLMAANQTLIHYALDLERPPLIACEAPDANKYTVHAADVTCPDCMSHEEFPMGAIMPKVTAKDVLMEAAMLLSETGENPEYDRAIVELTSALIGAGQDDRILMTRILRALAQRK